MGNDPVNEARIENLEKSHDKCEAERLKNEAEIYNEIKEVRKDMSTAIEGIKTEIQKQRTKFYAMWLSIAGFIIVGLGGMVLWFINYQFQHMMSILQSIKP